MIQAELNVKTCNKYQQFKRRNNIYEYLSLNIIDVLKFWNSLHIYLVGLYTKSIGQQHTGGAIIKEYLSLNCMKMVDPATSWFDIVKVL